MAAASLTRRVGMAGARREGESPSLAASLALQLGMARARRKRPGPVTPTHRGRLDSLRSYEPSIRASAPLSPWTRPEQPDLRPAHIGLEFTRRGGLEPRGNPSPFDARPCRESILITPQRFVRRHQHMLVLYGAPRVDSAAIDVELGGEAGTRRVRDWRHA